MSIENLLDFNNIGQSSTWNKNVSKYNLADSNFHPHHPSNQIYSNTLVHSYFLTIASYVQHSANYELILNQAYYEPGNISD